MSVDMLRNGQFVCACYVEPNGPASVVCFSVGKGLLWRRILSGHGLPILFSDKGTLFVYWDDRYCAFNEQGGMLWSSTVPTRVQEAQPLDTIFAVRVRCGSDSTALEGISRASGRPQWRKALYTPPMQQERALADLDRVLNHLPNFNLPISNLFSHDSNLFVATRNGVLYCFKSDGSEAWHTATGVNNAGVIGGDDSLLCVVRQEGVVDLFGLRNGDRVARRVLPMPESFLCATIQGNLVVYSTLRSMGCFDARRDRIVWEVKLGYDGMCPTFSVQGSLMFVGPPGAPGAGFMKRLDPGTIFVISMADGAQLFSFPNPGLSASVQYSDDRMILICRANVLTAFPTR